MIKETKHQKRNRQGSVSWLPVLASTTLITVLAAVLVYAGTTTANNLKDNIAGTLWVNTTNTGVQLPQLASNTLLSLNSNNFIQPVTLGSGFTFTNGTLTFQGSGTGTLTNFYSSNLAPLFTTYVTNGTTAPILAFGLNSQTNNVFFGSPDGTNGIPGFRAIKVSDLPVGYYYTNLSGAPTQYNWTAITNTPTSLSGYGITDPIVLTSGSYANPSWITSLAYSKITGAPSNINWSTITNTPTTLSGYGVTDPVVVTSGSYANPTWITSYAYSKLTGAPTLGPLSSVTPGGTPGSSPQTYLGYDGTNYNWLSTPGGTVTSVGLTMPSIFTVTGSPVTSSGSLAVTPANEYANYFWAGPTSGSPGLPSFRQMVSADLPVGTYNTLSISAAGTNTLSPASPINPEYLTVSSGTGSYTNAIVITRTGAVTGQLYELNVSIPASSNPTIQIYDNSSASTPLATLAGNGTAGATTLSYFYSGSAWVPFPKGALLKYQNLADIPNAATARTNLGIVFPISVANGGTGTSSPSLVAGTNTYISGTWPNQTINSSPGLTNNEIIPSYLNSTNTPSAGQCYTYQSGSQGYWSTPSGSGGTVTNVVVNNLSPLFTSSVSSPTLNPTVSYTLSNAAQNSVFAGPASGGTGAPSFQTAPTISGANITSLNGSSVSSGTVASTYLPTATSGAKGVVQGDGSTITLSSGVISATTATTGQLGVVKPDGSTITISSGVISASGGSSAILTPGFRNRIINGDFSVSQRNGTSSTSVTVTTSQTNYYLDRWFGNSTTAAASCQQITNPFTGSATTITSASNASPNVFTTSSAHGLNVGDQVIVSGGTGDTTVNGAFYVYSVPSSTTFQLAKPTGQVLNTGGTYTGSSASFLRFPQFKNGIQFTGATSNGGLAWGQKIESINAFDIATQGSAELSCYMVANANITVTWTAYYAGSTDNWTSSSSINTGTFAVTQTPQRFSAVINAAGLSNATTGLMIQFNVGSLGSGATITQTGVQLEYGNAVTAFEKLPISEIRSLCYRYYYQTPIFVNGSSVGDAFISLPTTMFTTPTVGGGGAGFTTQSTAPTGVSCYQTTGGAQTLTFNSEL